MVVDCCALVSVMRLVLVYIVDALVVFVVVVGWSLYVFVFGVGALLSLVVVT